MNRPIITQSIYIKVAITHKQMPRLSNGLGRDHRGNQFTDNKKEL